MIESGQLNPSERVWCEGMSDWQAVSELPTLQVPANDAGPGQIYQPPQAEVSGGTAGVPVKSYLWQSIACTLLCCLPAGIVAIIYAAKVDSLECSGQIDEAQKASEMAKTWCWVAFGVGLAVIVLAVFSESGDVSGSSY